MKQLGNLIDPFRAAPGTPPRSLWRFVVWGLSGAWPVLIVAAGISAFSGALEVGAALLLGYVIDMAVSYEGTAFFADHGIVLAAVVGFFLILRPLTLGIAAASNNIVVQPNIGPMVHMRLHRWTLGQPVTFFDNDFAGRIAQKEMQTSRAVGDVAVEVVNVVFFALATIVAVDKHTQQLLPT